VWSRGNGRPGYYNRVASRPSARRTHAEAIARDDRDATPESGLPPPHQCEQRHADARALHFTLCADGDEHVNITLGGDVRPPDGSSSCRHWIGGRAARVDERRVATASGQLTLRQFARHIELVY